MPLTENWIDNSFLQESYSTNSGGVGKKERKTSDYDVLENICSGVDVIEFPDHLRAYQVTYKRNTKNGVAPVSSRFSTIPEVLDSFQRVIESEIGASVEVASREGIYIPGESGRMADFSGRISSLQSFIMSPFSESGADQINQDMSLLIDELRLARNPHKVEAHNHLVAVFDGSSSRVQTNEIIGAGISVAKRLEQSLGISRAMLGRWRNVYRKRERWEQLIMGRNYQLIQMLAKLREGTLTDFDRQQIVFGVTGAPRGILSRLESVSGPEYHDRLIGSDVQGLSRLSDQSVISQDSQIERILQKAIMSLKNVKTKRDLRINGEKPL